MVKSNNFSKTRIVNFDTIAIRARSFFGVKACLVNCKLFSSTPDLCFLGANSIALYPSCENKMSKFSWGPKLPQLIP